MTKQAVGDLHRLEQQLLEASAIVEEMIEKSLEVLLKRHLSLIDGVLEMEQDINQREVQIEESVLRYLALHQPVASDLRRIASILKINNDLERIGDIAVNITERAECLATRPDFELPPQVSQMSSVSRDMLRDALDAFSRSDPKLALEVCERDDQVDDLLDEVTSSMFGVMRSESNSVEPALNIFSAARHIERLADHVTNIAEDVMFMVEGQIQRHKSDLSDTKESISK